MASTVWKGHLTFGLLSLPVKLYSAARSESVGFNQLHKADNSRVKQVLYCQAEDKPIPRSEIVKGEEVDAIFLESSYYMAPDEAGEKPYALLFEALRQSGCVGVAKIAMHNREHIVILWPGPKGILLHTMYYPDEIRQVEEFRTDTSLVKDKELAMAKMLIDSLLAAFEPEKYHDGYRENLMAMIQAKVEGKQIVETVETKHKAPVVDILEALKMSLAEVKKPIRSSIGTAAASTEEAVPAKKGRKAGS